MSRSAPRAAEDERPVRARGPPLLAGGDVEAVIAGGPVQRTGDVVGRDEGVGEHALQLRLVVEALADVPAETAAAVDMPVGPRPILLQVEHERIRRHDAFDPRRRRDRRAGDQPARVDVVDLDGPVTRAAERAEDEQPITDERPRLWGGRRRRLHGSSRAHVEESVAAEVQWHSDRAVADIEVGVVGDVGPAPAQVASPAELAGAGVDERRDAASALGGEDQSAEAGRVGGAGGAADSRRARGRSQRPLLLAGVRVVRRDPPGAEQHQRVADRPRAQLAVRRRVERVDRQRLRPGCQVGAPRLRQCGELGRRLRLRGSVAVPARAPQREHQHDHERDEERDGRHERPPAETGEARRHDGCIPRGRTSANLSLSRSSPRRAAAGRPSRARSSR